MRVVAGELRGRHISAPDGLFTRPTTDRVREATFNALVSLDLVDGAQVVDLYAGSGGLGIEAISRGAAHCRFVEKDRRALAALRDNLATLGIERRSTVVVGDALIDAGAMPPADLVLADPPYDFDGWAELLRVVRAPFVVAESGQSLAVPGGWDRVREKRYGRTVVAFLRRTDELP